MEVIMDMTVKSLLALALLICSGLAQHAKSQEFDDITDKVLQKAFGENCEESRRTIKIYLGSKGLAMAAEKLTIEPDGRVKFTPFSMAHIGKTGEKESAIITVQSEWALLKLDQPIVDLLELRKRKIMSVELPGGVRLGIK